MRTRRVRRWPIGLLALLVPLGWSCRAFRKKPDAGPPSAPGTLLASFDALGAAPSYPPRTVERLAVATVESHESKVTLSGGLVLKVVWDTRDDLAFARRYLTSARVEVAANTACNVYRTSAKPTRSRAAASASIQLDIDLDFVCVKDEKSQDFSGAVATLSAEGPTSISPKAVVQLPKDPPERPRVFAVHFPSLSAVFNDAATESLDGFVRVLEADPDLNVCTAYLEAKSGSAIQDKRIAAIRKYLTEHGVAGSRIQWVGTGQTPPLPDDIELWPRETACTDPRQLP